MSSNKNTFAIVVFIIILVIIGIGFFFFITKPSDKPADQQTSPTHKTTEATLVVIEQGIQITREGKLISTTVEEVSIYEGDLIKTDQSGAGYIVFADDSILAIDHDTEIEIEAHESTDTSTTVKIKQLVGKTRSNVKKVTGKDTEYSVETSNTLASVRGTKFGCETTEGITTCYSEDGNVQLTLKNITDQNIPNQVEITGGQSFENNDSNIFEIASLEDLIALIKKYVPEDSSWTDFVKCIDVGVYEYGISCEDIIKEIEESLPETGDDTTTVTTSIADKTTSTTTYNPNITTTTSTTVSTTSTTTRAPTTTTTTIILPPPIMSVTNTVGGPVDDMGISVTSDDSGSTYVTGTFQGTNVDFGDLGGLGQLFGWKNWATQHTSNGDDDVFLTKYNTDGSHAWTRTWGGLGSDVGKGVAVGPDGGVYVVGYFMSAEVNFDDTGGEYILDYGGVSDFFIVKYYTDGSFGWARQTGDPVGATYAGDVAIDANGDLVAVGNFSATSQDFDGTTGTDLHSTSGLDDVFVLRYNKNGNYGGTVTYGNSSTTSELGMDISTGGGGEIVIVGATIDNTFNAFIRKYNQILSLDWHEDLGGTANDEAWGVDIDFYGNIYVAGYYSGTGVEFDPSIGEEVHDAVGGEDAFLTVRDTTGGYLWTRTWGGISDDQASQVSTLGNTVTVTGMFSGLNTNLYGIGIGSSGIDLHSAFGGTNIFLSNYLTDGTFVEAVSFGETGDQQSWGVDIDYYGNVNVTGGFKGTGVEFDGINGGDQHTSNGGYDIFHTKYQNIIPLE